MRRWLVVLLAVASSCKSTIDLDTGRAYACTIDGGDDTTQCGAGYRCGLEGNCHRVGDAQHWKCAGAGDCEAQWTCGLEGTCHDPTKPSNYLCTIDAQCAGGWRCGFSGRCLDPSGEALGTRDAPATQIEVLAPKLATVPPTGGLFAFDPSGFTFRRGTEWVTAPFTGQAPWIADAGASDGGAVAFFNNHSFIVEGSEFSLLDVFTGARQVLFHPDGGKVDATGAQLRTLRDISAGEVALVRNSAAGSTYVLANSAAIVFGVLPGPPAPISDLTSVQGCGVATTPNGVFTCDLTQANWAALSIPGFNGCGLAASFEPLRLRTTEGLTAVAGSAIGAELKIAVFDTLQFGSGTADAGRCVAPVSSSCEDGRWAPRLGPCSPCENGDRLVDFHPVSNPGDPAVVVECSNVLGETTTFSVLRASTTKLACARGLVNGPSDLSPVGADSPNPSMFGRAGQHGQFWFGASATDSRPVFFNRAPVVLAAAADGGAPMVFAPSLRGVITPGIGIPASQADFNFVAAVEGDPTLVMNDLGQIQPAEQVNAIAGLKADSVDVRAPFHAAIAPKPDGGQELIATSFDTLYSGVYDGFTYELTSKLKPFPGSPIESIAPFLEQVPDAGTRLAAWVLTPNGLFKVRSESDKRWRAVDVPLPPGDAVEVWTEGDKGRIGFNDGVVFSLPSRVPLSSPLPLSDVAFDYLFACSETWVLGFDGVYRLSPRPGGVGEWVLEPLTTDLYTFGPDPLYGGRLFALRGRIYLFTYYGGALSFAPKGGCGP